MTKEVKQEQGEPDDLTIAYMTGLYDGKKQAKQEQGEPVAWVIHSNGEEHGLDFWQDEINALPIGTFLYTTPQTKEWAGLTDEQYKELSQLTHVEVIKLIEDILKNNNT